MSQTRNIGRGPEEKIGEGQEQTTKADPRNPSNVDSASTDLLSAPERAVRTTQQVMNSPPHSHSTAHQAPTDQVSDMQALAQESHLEDDHEATEASEVQVNGESVAESARQGMHLQDDGDTDVGGADAIDVKEVHGAIALLTHTLQGDVYSVVTDAPKTDKQITLQAPQLHLLKLQFSKYGTVWTGGLVRWLRSASVMQIVAMWVRECWQDTFVRSALENFLPESDFPWASQHKSIVELAKQRDLRKPLTDPAKDVQTLCAVYGRNIFLCNRETLIDNSPSGDDFLNYHLLDLPCAVILTAFYDLRKMGNRGFIVQVLKSPLVKPMHSDVREKVEQDYAVDPSLSFSSEDATRFYTPSTESFASSSTPLKSKKKIDQKARYRIDPFNKKEELAFLTAYRDWPKSDPVGAAYTNINYAYIAEILPGRCVDEVKEYYRINKAWLTKSATPLSKSAVVGQKRGREDEDGDDDNTGPSRELKKQRVSLNADDNDVQAPSPADRPRFIYHPRKGVLDMNPPAHSERFKLSRSEFEREFNNAPMIKKRHREIAAQNSRVHEVFKAYDEAEKAVREHQSKLKVLSVSKMLYAVRMRSTMSKRWKLQRAERLLIDKETHLLHEEVVLNHRLMELETSRARCWRDEGDEAAPDGIEINKSKARHERNRTAASNAPDTHRHDKAASGTNSKAAVATGMAQQGASGGSAHLGDTEKTMGASQNVGALMKRIEKLEAENASLKATQDHRA